MGQDREQLAISSMTGSRVRTSSVGVEPRAGNVADTPREPKVSAPPSGRMQAPSDTCVIRLQLAKHRLWYSLPSSAQTSCRVPAHEATQPV